MPPFVTPLPSHLHEKLRNDLSSQGFSFSRPPYTIFAARKKGVSCTLYTSGKLVIQGKEMNPFIEFYLEPELLKAFPYTHTPTQPVHPHIGVDESGKGDFFGPLCIAAVFGDEKQIEEWRSIGVGDSKKIAEKKLLSLAQQIRKGGLYKIVSLFPERYNTLYEKMQNLNDLLGWGHATVISDLVEQSGCTEVLIDQFANERVVERALEKKGTSVALTQRHRGEEDIVVAAASILAREAFIQGIQQLEQRFKTPLPKGASSLVVQAGKAFVEKHGKDSLPFVAKMHFRTLFQITGSQKG